MILNLRSASRNLARDRVAGAIEAIVGFNEQVESFWQKDEVLTEEHAMTLAVGAAAVTAVL